MSTNYWQRVVYFIYLKEKGPRLNIHRISRCDPAMGRYSFMNTVYFFFYFIFMQHVVFHLEGIAELAWAILFWFWRACSYFAQLWDVGVPVASCAVPLLLTQVTARRRSVSWYVITLKLKKTILWLQWEDGCGVDWGQMSLLFIFVFNYIQ